MKKTLCSLMLVGIAASMGGCAYGGVAVSGDKAIIARNDAFLFGVMRKVFVCKIADSGVSSCNANENP